MNWEPIAHWWRCKWTFKGGEVRSPAVKGAIERMEEGVFERLNIWNNKQIRFETELRRDMEKLRKDVEQYTATMQGFVPALRVLSAKARCWDEHVYNMQDKPTNKKRKKARK